MFPKETSNSMLRPRTISNNNIPNGSNVSSDNPNNNNSNSGNNPTNNQSSVDQSQNNNNNNGSNNNPNNNNNGNQQNLSNKKVQWNKDYVIWLNPTALDKLREQLTNKKHLEFEVRSLIQKIFVFIRLYFLFINYYISKYFIYWILNIYVFF